MRRRPDLRRPIGERGSATVEFSLVLPLLLVLALGLIQVGVLARDRLLTEAGGGGGAGARAAAVGDDPVEIEAAVHAAAPALDPTATTVSVAREGGRGAAVSVRVDYDDGIRVPLVGWLVGSTVHLSSTATMRQEFG